MSSYNIDEDPVYQRIRNGGDISSSNSMGFTANTHGLHNHGNNFNFHDISNDKYGSQSNGTSMDVSCYSNTLGAPQAPAPALAPAAAEADDEFGDLEVPEGGFGEPQTLEDMIGKGHDSKKNRRERNTKASRTVTSDSAKIQKLQHDLESARDEIANLRSQVNVAQQPWPTALGDLPRGDPIFLEVEGMFKIACQNYDQLQNEANDSKNKYNEVLDHNSDLQTQINNLNHTPSPLQAQLNQSLRNNRDFQTRINNLSSAPNPLQAQLNESLSENVRLQGEIDSLRFAPNPLQAQLNEAVAENRRLEGIINGMNVGPNQLQSDLDTALGAKARLQDEVDSFKSAVNPLDAEIKSKNKEIEDLRKENEKLASSETDFKKKAEDLDTNLSSANRRIENLERAAYNAAIAAEGSLKAKQASLDAAEWKLIAANRKLELRKPSFENEILLEDENRKLHTENNELKRENWKLVHEVDQRIVELCEEVDKLRLEKKDPRRKVLLAEAAVIVAKYECQAHEISAGVELKKEKKEKEKEKKEKQKQGIAVGPVPGAWTENPVELDLSIPNPSALLAIASASVKDSVDHKVVHVKDAALSAKSMATSCWDQLKNTVYIALLLFGTLLYLCHDDILADNDAAINSYVEGQSDSDSLWSGHGFYHFAGMVVVGAFIYLYNFVCGRMKKSEDALNAVQAAQFEEVVQANHLIYQYENRDPKVVAEERWQEFVRKNPGWSQYDTSRFPLNCRARATNHYANKRRF